MRGISLVITVPRSAAARSRAMPEMPSASGRFGVTAISITGSFRPSTSAIGVPTGVSSATSMMPACSSDRPISRSETSMPFDSTPRILVGLRCSPVPGMSVPDGAKMPFMPVRAFGAPQTTCTSPSAVSTLQTLSLSAFGCCSAETT